MTQPNGMTLIDNMRKLGYCIAPNNIHGRDGVRMYPAGPGVMGLAEWNCMAEIWVSDVIRIIRDLWMEGRYLGDSVMETFATADDFAAWIAAHGKHSKGGVILDQGNWD